LNSSIEGRLMSGSQSD